MSFNDGFAAHHMGAEGWPKMWSQIVGRQHTPEKDRAALDKYAWECQIEALAAERQFNTMARHRRPRGKGEVRMAHPLGFAHFAVPEQVMAQAVERLHASEKFAMIPRSYPDSEAGSFRKQIDTLIASCTHVVQPRAFTEQVMILGIDRARFGARRALSDAEYAGILGRFNEAREHREAAAVTGVFDHSYDDLGFVNAGKIRFADGSICWFDRERIA